jgi:hypothetical protein
LSRATSDSYSLKLIYFENKNGTYARLPTQFVETNFISEFRGRKFKRDELKCFNKNELDTFVSDNKNIYKTKNYSTNSIGGVCLNYQTMESHWTCLGLGSNEVLASEIREIQDYEVQLRERLNLFYLQYIPNKAVEYLKSHYPLFKKISSCALDFNTDSSKDYLVGLVDENLEGRVIGLVMKADTVTLEVPVIKNMKLESFKDNWELYCESKMKPQYVSDTDYKPKKGESVIAVKSHMNSGLTFYAFDKKAKQFKTTGFVSPGD